MSLDPEVISTWLANEGLAFARNFIVFLLILIAGFIAAKFLSRVATTAVKRSVADPSPILLRSMSNILRKVILLLAFVIGLDNLGVDAGALIAGLGASGLVLGFALKDTLSNFAAGFLLLLYRPFDAGHFVEVAGTTGIVTDITIVSTVLRTPDNKVITLPNSEVWGKAITNYTSSENRRIDIVAGIAYDADIDRTREIFLEILNNHPKVLEEPAPAVTMAELNDSSVDFNVRPWVNTEDFWPVRHDIIREIKLRLDAEGIGIPFPQREVWLHQLPNEAA